MKWAHGLAGRNEAFPADPPSGSVFRVVAPRDFAALMTFVSRRHGHSFIRPIPHGNSRTGRSREAWR